jgi:uncharacterized protein with HEPN domain
MHNEYIKDNLESVLESIKIVRERFENIKKADDFMKTPAGITLLDSIAMRLQVVGELIKNIDKADSSYLKKYKAVEWEKIIRMRDLISHHYDTVNPELVYDICLNHLPSLESTIKEMLK